jgi:hypothetical protein
MSLGASFSDLDNDLITIIKVSFDVFEKVVSNQIIKTKANDLTLVLLRNLQMIGKQIPKEKKKKTQVT